MSDAPDCPRIWLEPLPEDNEARLAHHKNCWGEDATEYIRADIAQRWKEALEEIAGYKGYQLNDSCLARDIAQKALSDE